MLSLFYKFPQTIRKIFSGHNLIFHVLAIVLTYLIVTSGFDWRWFTFFRHSAIYPYFIWGAGIGGFVLPVFIPLTILAIGKIRKNKQAINTAWATGQAALLGMLTSWFYKVFTGRPGPELSGGLFNAHPATDITHIFRFGILRGGVFWGWPSSHTMVAVSVAVCLVILFPKNKKIIIPALLIALYIGFGASIGFHWFSDVVAGAIIGTVVGMAVGKSFKVRAA